MSNILKRAKNKVPTLGKIKQRVEIDMLRPADKKGFTVKVEKETASGFQTKAYGQDKYMVWKTEEGAGYSFPGYDKYFCVEGEVLTSYITETKENKTVPIAEFLKDHWPEGAYEKMRENAPELVAPLEDLNWAATVQVKPSKIDPAAETTLSVVKAQEILKDASLEIANDAARAKVKVNKWTGAASDAIKYITGGAVLYFLEHALELF